MSIATIIFIVLLLHLQAYFGSHAPRWVQVIFWLVWTVASSILLWWVTFGDLHTCRFLCN